MAMAKLKAKGGHLHLNRKVLLVIYPEGDCDQIAWPLSDRGRKNLRHALYDERETGGLPADAHSVELPNGVIFSIDG
jgi:hypothetical protein